MKRVSSIIVMLLTLLVSFSFEKGNAKGLFASPVYMEKIFLHIDRYEYYSGETIWFKVYLVDSKTHQQDPESNVVYVDLLNQSQIPVCSRIINIEKENGAGDFQIPADLQTGEYKIRAYTRYMANFDPEWFFFKTVYITSHENNVRVNINNTTSDKLKSDSTLTAEESLPQTALQFFPEGGSMVNDLINQLAFKAVNSEGRGIEVNGAIVDQNGNELMNFQTQKFGLGALSFVPHKGQSYKARYIYNGRDYECNFPASSDSGVVMQVVDLKDHYNIIVRSSLAHGTKEFRLTGCQRNKMVTSSMLEGVKEGVIIDISKKLLETGVVQFTLFDEKGFPLCERLAFVESSDQTPLVRIDSLKGTYRMDEHIDLFVSPADSLKNDSTAAMSMSVVNSSALKNPDDDLNIQSYMLLKSELKGEIEHPSYYLFSPDPDRRNMLDLLMLTQGWRQFIINDTLSSQNVKYLPEKGLSFRGHVRRFAKDGKPAKAIVTLFYSNKQEDAYYETTTDKTGYFEFEGLDIAENTKIIIQAKKTGVNEGVNDPQKYFVIVLDSLNIPARRNNEPDSPNRENKKELTEKSASIDTEAAYQWQKGDIMLDEVVVTEKRKDPYKQVRTMYSEPSYSVDFNEIQKYEGASDILDILKKYTTSRIFYEQLSVNPNQRSFLYLLNGMPVSQEAALSVPITEIGFVDILEGPKTIIYGSSGANGVIAIYTLNGTDVVTHLNIKVEKGIMKLTHPGFNYARKFYEPAYPLSKNNSPDLIKSLTVYWNPNVSFAGQNRISFHIPGTMATYQVTVEGVTSEGKIIHSVAKFEVR